LLYTAASTAAAAAAMLQQQWRWTPRGNQKCNAHFLVQQLRIALLVCVGFFNRFFTSKIW